MKGFRVGDTNCCDGPRVREKMVALALPVSWSLNNINENES